jgi:hypothetical protein
MGNHKNLQNIKVHDNSTDSPKEKKKHFEGLFPD